MDKPKYATLEELGRAIANLEQKVPSRWEVRTLILGAIIVNNTAVPHEVTAAAIAAGAVGVVWKIVSVLFLRN